MNCFCIKICITPIYAHMADKISTSTFASAVYVRLLSTSALYKEGSGGRLVFYCIQRAEMTWNLQLFSYSTRLASCVAHRVSACIRTWALCTSSHCKNAIHVLQARWCSNRRKIGIIIGEGSAKARTISPSEKSKYHSVWLSEIWNSCTSVFRNTRA